MYFTRNYDEKLTSMNCNKFILFCVASLWFYVKINNIALPFYENDTLKTSNEIFLNFLVVYLEIL